MATTGAIAPGTITSNNAVGTVPWTNPGNAASSNDAYATAPTGATGVYTEYLFAANFGFAVPVGATIDLVTVSIERSKQLFGAANVWDSDLKLVVGGAVSGNDKGDALATNWPTTDTVATYAFTPAEWGVELTADAVNASTFGVALSVFLGKLGGGTSYARVDAITITIDYTAGGSPAAQRRSGVAMQPCMHY